MAIKFSAVSSIQTDPVTFLRPPSQSFQSTSEMILDWCKIFGRHKCFPDNILSSFFMVLAFHHPLLSAHNFDLSVTYLKFYVEYKEMQYLFTRELRHIRF